MAYVKLTGLIVLTRFVLDVERLNHTKLKTQICLIIYPIA